MVTHLIVATIIGWMVTQAASFSVYDCNSNATTYSSIDLTKPEPCQGAERQFDTGRNIQIQLLQTETQRPIRGYQCKVILTREVSRCGFTSINYGSQFPILRKTMEVTPNACRRAIQTNQLTIDERKFTVKLGAAVHYQYFRFGFRDEKGNCKTTNFRTGGIWFENSYERTELQLEIAMIRGFVDTATATVKFTNGLQTRFKDGIIKDNAVGTIVWNTTDPPCHEELSEIYLGQAILYHRQKTPHSNLQALLMVENNATDQYAGLVLESPTSICRVHGYSTHIKGIVVILLRSGDSPIPQANFRESMDLSHTNVQGQLSFLHLSTNMAVGDKLASLWAQVCEIAQKTLHNKLQSIAGTANPYSILDTHGPGYSVYAAGAVAYIARCEEKEATMRSFNNCTMEIPIMVNGQPLFADPLTMLIKQFPTILPCDDLLPIKWLISGAWYCGTPRIHLCDAPQQLVTTGPSYQEHDYTIALGGGMYTKEQIDAHRRFQLVYESRTAVWVKLTTESTDTPTGEPLRPPLSSQDIKKLGKSIAEQVVPMFRWFGTAFVDLVGILFICGILKIIAGALVRAYMITKQRGVGVWMLAAVWHTAFLVAMMPVVTIKKVYQEVVQQDPEPEDQTRGMLGEDVRQQIEDLQRELHRIQAQVELNRIQTQLAPERR